MDILLREWVIKDFCEKLLFTFCYYFFKEKVDIKRNGIGRNRVACNDEQCVYENTMLSIEINMFGFNFMSVKLN